MPLLFERAFSFSLAIGMIWLSLRIFSGSWFLVQNSQSVKARSVNAMTLLVSLILFTLSIYRSENRKFDQYFLLFFTTCTDLIDPSVD